MGQVDLTTDLSAGTGTTTSVSDSVAKYSGNPTISGADRDWVGPTVRKDGTFYQFVNWRSGGGSAVYTDLYIGDSLHDLSAYSGNHIVSNGYLHDIFKHDGKYFAIAWDYAGGSREIDLWLSDDLVDWTEYSGNPAFVDTDFGSWSGTSGLLHPDALYDYGTFGYSIIDFTDREEGYVTTDTPEGSSYTDHGLIMSGQASWESGDITNAHEYVVDGQRFVGYSGGPSGSDRNIGVRWGKTVREFNDNYFTEAMVSSTESWEGTYVNWGDVHMADEWTLYYFGLGTEDSGVLTFDYWNLKETEVTVTGQKTVTVYEDVGADGTGPSSDPNGKAYDNSATQQVEGGTNTYRLDGFDSSSGNEYWLRAELSSTDRTQTPTLNSGEVTLVSTTVNVPAATATVAAPAPSGAGDGEATIDAPAAVTTATAPTPTVAVGTVAITPPVATGTASAPLPSADTGTATIAPPTATATGAAPTPGISPVASTIGVPAATATVAAPVPSATGEGGATLSLPAASATASGLVPRLSKAGVIAVPAATATTAAPAPSATGEGEATVDAPSAAATGVASAPTATGDGTVALSPPTATAAASAPVPTLSYPQTIDAPTATAMASAPVPSLVIAGSVIVTTSGVIQTNADGTIQTTQ